MKYPSIEQVRGASASQLLEWNRFLPNPENEDHIEVLNLIVEQLTEVQKRSPESITNASKSIGWDR